MTKAFEISRRQFVGSAISAAAAASVPLRHLSRPLNEETSSSAFAGSSTSAGWKDEGVLNLAKSPHAKLQNVPVHAVTITSGFWAARRQTNVEKSIPSMEKLLEANGRMDNFLRLEGKTDAPQRGPVYSDSDVYKWTEAAGFALQSGDRAELRGLTDKIIKEVVAAQEPSGYLNTYYVGEHAKDRMTPEVQRWGHELYNIGHLIQGAIAYYRATGDTTLLDAGVHFVNGFLLPKFGPGPDKKPIFSGHPEIELALIELHRTTGDKRHLELAGYILQGDDRIKVSGHGYVYHFCGIPFTSRTHLEGHAVRCMYACSGATDYYLETGDPTYWKTLNMLWNDMTSTKLYVTGGVGSRSDGEAFGDAYELPNFRAYGESCAAIGNMMWNWRMLAVTGDAKFTDVIERALYNGINSGMSLDGTLYCYRNPLAFDPSTGDKIRNPWYDVTCCPPNLERTFGSLPGYFYSTSSDGIYVHLYDNSQLDWHLEDGTGLKVTQKTNYPWDGGVDIAVTPAQPADFCVYLRIPGWVDRAQVLVNNRAQGGATPGEYLAIRRRWLAGDVIQLKLEVVPEVIRANPRVADDTGRVAIQRGPLIYCLEEIDQPGGISISDVAVNPGRDPAEQFQSQFRSRLLGGMVVLPPTGAAYQRESPQKALYARYGGESVKTRKVPLTFIPYYAWANRQATAMQVWNLLLET